MTNARFAMRTSPSECSTAITEFAQLYRPVEEPICALCRADNRQDFRPEELIGMDRRNRADRAHRVEQEFQDLRRANFRGEPIGGPQGTHRGGRVMLTQAEGELKEAIEIGRRGGLSECK